MLDVLFIDYKAALWLDLYNFMTNSQNTSTEQVQCVRACNTKEGGSEFSTDYTQMIWKLQLAGTGDGGKIEINAFMKQC